MNINCKTFDSLPLKAIQFQTIDMCNRSCDFCPNKIGLRKTGAYMTDFVFFRILERLREINFKGRISPYLMNEPLLDARLPAWIQTIRRNFPKNIIFINSNGDAILSQSMRDRLADSGLDGIQLNCYDSEDEFKNKVEIVEHWAKEDSRIFVHYSGSLRRMNKRNGKVNVRVKYVSELLPSFWNRAGHIPLVIPSVKYGGLGKCSFLFEQMYINHLGQAILCCSDYKFEVVLGSVVDASLSAIWNGQDYRKYRTSHENSDYNSLLLCRSCNRVTTSK